jgi:SAM-dependent methyltransferase
MLLPNLIRRIAAQSTPVDRSLSLKALLKSRLRAFSFLPVISTFVHYNRFVRRVFTKVPIIRSIYDNGLSRIHPFDVLYGTDTSGANPDGEFITEETLAIHAHGYSGSQPSILRGAFATLPGLESCTFLDLGCGKGRPSLIATEFPFKDIVGVELSPVFGEIARKNAEKIAKLYPDRTRVQIVVGDASAYPMPTGDVVLFLYNPFKEELMRKVVALVEEALASERRRIFIVYLNPIFGTCFDASPALTRRFAKMVRYAPEEMGFGWYHEDLLVIWQGGDVPPVEIKADAKIIVNEHNFSYIE